MRFTLIGHFPPPYDVVTIANFQIAAAIRQRGDECITVNVAEKAGIGIIAFLSFLVQIMAHARRTDVLHFLTRGYDRTSVFYLFFVLLIGVLWQRRRLITVYPELFSFLGPLRSRHVGKPLFKLCFHLAHEVYCGDEAVHEVVLELGGPPEKCVLRPQRIAWEEITLTPPSPALADYIQNRAYVVALFAAADSHYLLQEADALIPLLQQQFGSQFGLILCGPEVVFQQYAFWQSDHFHLLEPTLAEATWIIAHSHWVLRPLYCLGQRFMPDSAFMLEKPERLPGGWLAVEKGLVLVRKGRGFFPSVTQRQDEGEAVEPTTGVSEWIVRSRPRQVLLVGNFGPRAYEETILNEAIKREIEAAGIACEAICLTQNSFDSAETHSFFDFIRHMVQHIRRNDVLLYMTQGYTRPSLLLLFISTILARLYGKQAYVFFHQDLFSFFTQLRSRNAGLPLLFTAFTLAKGIIGNEESCTVARQYKNKPEKFYSVRPTMPLHQPAAPLSVQTRIRAMVLDGAEPHHYEDIVCGLNALGIHGVESVTHSRNGHNNNEAWGQQAFLYQVAHLVVRPLQCNGEMISSAAAFVLENPQKQGGRVHCDSGAIVIRKGKTRLTEFLPINSVDKSA